MEIQQNIDLAPYNSFGISQRAAFFADIRQADDLQQALAFAAEHKLPIQLLGGGSNTLFVKDYPGLLVHMNCRGIERLPDQVSIRAGCGENWHELVKYCLSNELHGIENLALIPGTVGAAPIQNIGAYGVELEQVFVELEAFDCRSGELRTMNKADCEFAYRDSIFKHDASQSLIVLSVTLRLSHEFAPNTEYYALKDALAGTVVSPASLFETVCEIRRRKLPDPEMLGNAGSFFKNPVISSSKYELLREQYPELPAYDAEQEGTVKIPAAWLLEEIGSKDRSHGGAAVHSEHSLVLVNRGSASGEDIQLLAQQLSNCVLRSFGIALQTEVRIV